MIFAVRETGRPLPVRGLDVLRLSGLPRAAATALLDGHAPRLTTPVRERVLEESGGNPLGLIELATAIDTAERSGGSDLAQQVGPLQVTERVQEVFRSQIAELPDATRLLLVVAAADGAPVWISSSTSWVHWAWPRPAWRPRSGRTSSRSLMTGWPSGIRWSAPPRTRALPVISEWRSIWRSPER